MPGTIQVSILELVGLPSLPQSSSMGIKVSMGKQAHEFREKGDHSFALASLRDNFSVLVHDSEGNEIARTVVETRSIIEKGTWEDLFTLEGGGHVRMRLHFVLTEDEKNKIRSMRESAARRKREDIIKRSRSSSDLSVAPGGSSGSSGDSRKTTRLIQQKTVSPDRHTNMISAGSNAIVLSKVSPGQKKQGFSSSKSTGALDKLPGYQRIKEEIQQEDGEQHKQSQRTPRNVRNMVLAFESSPVKQEAVPAANKTKGTSRLSSITSTNISLIPPKKTAAVSAKPVLSDLETVPAPSLVENVNERGAKEDYMAGQETFSPTIEQFKESKVQSIDQMFNEKYVSKMEPITELDKEELKAPKELQLETTSDDSKLSWKAFFGALPRGKYNTADILTDQQVSTCYDSLVLKRTWRSKHWKASQYKVKSKASYGNEYYSSDSHHGWIFLEETINSCVPNDERPFREVSEDALSNCSRASIKEKVRENEVVPSKNEKNTVERRDTESSGRPHSRDPIQPVRQVINIAVMVGFGLLVLLTRQRK